MGSEKLKWWDCQESKDVWHTILMNDASTNESEHNDDISDGDGHGATNVSHTILGVMPWCSQG